MPEMRVLYVEDDPSAGRLLRAIGERQGFAVEVTPTGHEALKAHATRPCDVMVVDLGLPDGTGIDVIRRVRERELDLPIVVLTGSQEPQDVVQAMKAGATDYLFKPFDVAEGARVLEEAARAAARQRELGRLWTDLAHVLWRAPGRDHLQHLLRRAAQTLQEGPRSSSPPAGAGEGLVETVERIERTMIREALDKHGWVKARAARALGVTERILSYKIHTLGLAKAAPNGFSHHEGQGRDR
jgi:DNA-binding NtrC family response regulator